jgi:hypothetical protein
MSVVREAYVRGKRRAQPNDSFLGASGQICGFLPVLTQTLCPLRYVFLNT